MEHKFLFSWSFLKREALWASLASLRRKFFAYEFGRKGVCTGIPLSKKVFERLAHE